MVNSQKSNHSLIKVISIPGTYNEGSGIGDYTSEQQIVADVIEVIPDEGAYYDNARGQSCNTLEGYKYYYYDDNGDGNHNVIFIVDSDGNVASIGLDTDGNSYFEPFKLMLVEKHIMQSELSSEAEVMDLVKMYAGHDMVVYQDYDNYDGLFLEPTFRDSLYDVWKMDYYSGTTQLMELAKSITSHRFLESLSPMKIVGDIAFQVGAQLVAYVTGKIVGIGLASAY